MGLLAHAVFWLVLAGVVTWRRRRRRRGLLAVPGEFYLWPLGWGFVGRRSPLRVRVAGSFVTVYRRSEVAPRQLTTAGSVRVRVMPKTWWRSQTYLRLEGLDRAGAYAVTSVRLRPIGELDRDGTSDCARSAQTLTDLLASGGAEVAVP